MKLVFISDTHGQHNIMTHPLPEGDVLIHAGDATNVGSEKDIRKFVHWFQNIKGFDYKIFIAGNHDFGFEGKPPWLSKYINEENLSQSDCIYLEDESFEIESSKFSRPIKFYGTPWQPEFMNWAFNAPRDQIYKHWEKIPLDTDILITHGPPEEILDLTPREGRVGCASLRHYVEKIKPIINVFGHIHGQYGIATEGKTTFVNASTCTERYVPSNKPIVLSLREFEGEFIVNIVDSWNY